MGGVCGSRDHKMLMAKLSAPRVVVLSIFFFYFSQLRHSQHVFLHVPSFVACLESQINTATRKLRKNTADRQTTREADDTDQLRYASR